MPNSEIKTARGSNESWAALLEGSIPIDGTAGERYLCRERAILTDAARSADVLFQPRFPFPALRGNYTRPAVVFGLRGGDGETVAIQARSLTGKMFYSSPGTCSGVFVASFGVLDGNSPVFICEAPIDALSLESAGLPAISTSGPRILPPWLVDRLQTRTVYNCHDDDEGGDQAAALIEKALHRECPRLFAADGCKDWNEQLVKQGPDALAKGIDAELRRPST